MNGTTTNKGQIYIIVCAIAILAVICVVTVCVLSYLQIKVPPELNTLTGGLVGYLAAMLVKTSPTETLKVPPVAPLQNGATPVTPTPVQVVNPETNPVQTHESDQTQK